MEKRYYGTYMPYWLRLTGTESVASEAEREERKRQRNRRNQRFTARQLRQLTVMRARGIDEEEIACVLRKTEKQLQRVIA